MKAMMENFNPESMIMTPETIAQRRIEVNAMIERDCAPYGPYCMEFVKQCTYSEIELKVGDGATITIYSYRPKSLPKEGNACEIHAHGGGAIMCDAKMINEQIALWAVQKGCVYFNVNYRKGPETKCPGG